MRLSFQGFDGRRRLSKLGEKVCDQEGKKVGHVHQSSSGGREISLFGKYDGSFASDEECRAFMKGVEAVLNHMVSLPERPPQTRKPEDLTDIIA